MAQLPYGGFEADPDSANDDGWTKLEDIQMDLESGAPIPPHLAHWLGEAIKRCDGDANEFLRLLGLKKRRGGQRTKFTREQALHFGYKVCQLEDEGMKAEAALSAVLETIEPQPERGQIQKWRDEYRAMLKETHAINLENAATE